MGVGGFAGVELRRIDWPAAAVMAIVSLSGALRAIELAAAILFLIYVLIED